MTTDNRPLSPHLQIYKPHLTMILSITHRGTGMALAVGLLMLLWWLFAAATGAGAFAVFQEFSASWIGRLVLFGWSFALFYHLCNGIRHFVWDVGRGYEVASAYFSAWLVIVAAIVLTLLAWWWGYANMGAL